MLPISANLVTGARTTRRRGGRGVRACRCTRTRSASGESRRRARGAGVAAVVAQRGGGDPRRCRPYGSGLRPCGARRRRRWRDRHRGCVRCARRAVLAAALVGWALADPGCAARGPAAEPADWNSSSPALSPGAAFCLVLAVALGGPAFLGPLAAFAGAPGAVAIVLAARARRAGRTTTLTCCSPAS